MIIVIKGNYFLFCSWQVLRSRVRRQCREDEGKQLVDSLHVSINVPNEQRASIVLYYSQIWVEKYVNICYTHASHFVIYVHSLFTI